MAILRTALTITLSTLSVLALTPSAWAGSAPNTAPYEWKVPLGFPDPSELVPEDNPISHEKVELGRLLFYDTRLSGNQTFSCASCHQQKLAFTDGLARSLGSTGEEHPRSAMALANIVYAPTLTWANNVLEHLEEQALVPMFGEFPVELGLAGKEDELLARLRAEPLYQRMFAEAFPDEEEAITLSSIVRSIANFQRTLLSGNSLYDQWLFGDDDALSDSALRGLELILDQTGKTECGHCHAGFNFTGSRTEAGQVLLEKPYFNTGLYNLNCRDFSLPDVSANDYGCYPPNNVGLFEVSTFVEHMGAFKPPTLRNICVTAPYMHDGSIETLDEVLDHYAAGGRTIESGPLAGDGSANPLKSGFLVGFRLTDQERSDIKEFLCSLTDEEFLNNPHFADPFVASSCSGDCDFNGSVSVGEVIRQVNISLGKASLAVCLPVDANRNGQVHIGELIRSVRQVLDGCPNS